MPFLAPCLLLAASSPGPLSSLHTTHAHMMSPAWSQAPSVSALGVLLPLGAWAQCPDKGPGSSWVILTYFFISCVLRQAVTASFGSISLGSQPLLLTPPVWPPGHVTWTVTKDPMLRRAPHSA